MIVLLSGLCTCRLCSFVCVCDGVGFVLGVLLGVLWVMGVSAECVHAYSKWQTSELIPKWGKWGIIEASAVRFWVVFESLITDTQSQTANGTSNQNLVKEVK